MRGFVGPVFWPYAYDDCIDYLFWPYAYDTFWPYAFDDVYQGIYGGYAPQYYAPDDVYAYAGAPASSAVYSSATGVSRPSAALAGDIDEAGGSCGLDHVGVAGRLGQGLWINEADLVHGAPLLPGPDSRTSYAESLKPNQDVMQKSASAIVRWNRSSTKAGSWATFSRLVFARDRRIRSAVHLIDRTALSVRC